MPKKIIAVLLSVLVIVTAFALPTFAAEDEAAAAPSVDWSQYPTMNLITFPYISSTVSSGGLNWHVQDDFGVAVKGEITGYSQFTLADIPLASDTTYTFNLGQTVLSCGITAEIILLDSLGLSVSKIYVSLQRRFVSFSTADYDNVVSARISLLRQSHGLSTNFVDCVIYPMFNVGSEPYPFSPYMPYLLEQQYNNGYSSGEAAGSTSGYDKGYAEGESAGLIQGAGDGFKEGYQAGLDASAQSMNPFAMPFSSTVEARITYTASGGSQGVIANFEQEIPVSVRADYSINFSAYCDVLWNSFVNAVIAVYPDVNVSTIDVSYVTIVFDWLCVNEDTGAFYFDASSVLRFSEYSSINRPAVSCVGFEDGSSKTVALTSIQHGESFSYVFSDSVDLSKFSAYQLKISLSSSAIKYRPSDCILSALSDVTSPTYLAGYNQGYFDGAKDGLDEQADLFFDQGYNQGFKEGKKEGLKFADTGDWQHLILAVTEAPINTFQSLFNFEILGMDMRAAFGSILALCVFLIILKKVIL